MLVHDLLRRAAAETPDAIAIVEPRRAIRYGELDAYADRVANLLIRGGTRRGDRVVVAIENSLEFVGIYFGTMRAGAVAVPLPAGPRSDRLHGAVADCSPHTCIVDRKTATDPRVARSLAGVDMVLVHGADERNAARTDGDRWLPLASALKEWGDTAPPPSRTIDRDLASIIYTSGSTGAPRGVMLSHRNIIANTDSIVEYLALDSRDRVMCVLPLYYVYGLSLLHTHVAVGGSIVLDNRFVYPNVVLEAMRTHAVTGFAGVPSTFALLLHRSNLTSMTFPTLRYVTQAGGGMPPARILEWLERGPQVPFFVMYGATEASARLTCLPPGELRRKLGSIGRAIPNVEIQVVKEDGRPAATGEVGELVARGANISQGYWQNATETQERFGPLGYRTGDLGYADQEGFLFLVGRRHDMIKVGAHRVGSREIEDVLHEHPEVHEAAVVAVADDILGEVPVAFVALRDGGRAPQRGLEEFCRQRLAPHKVPVSFFVESDLPKLPGIGKIDKVTLRTRALSRVQRSPASVEAPQNRHKN